VFAIRCPAEEIHFARGALDVKGTCNGKSAMDGFLYCNWMPSYLLSVIFSSNGWAFRKT